MPSLRHAVRLFLEGSPLLRRPNRRPGRTRVASLPLALAHFPPSCCLQVPVDLRRSSLRPPLGLFLRSSLIAHLPVPGTALRINPQARSLPLSSAINRRQSPNNRRQLERSAHFTLSSAVRSFVPQRTQRRNRYATAPLRLPLTLSPATDDGLLDDNHDAPTRISSERLSSPADRFCSFVPIDTSSPCPSRAPCPFHSRSITPAHNIRDGLNLRAGPNGRSPQNQSLARHIQFITVRHG